MDLDRRSFCAALGLAAVAPGVAAAGSGRAVHAFIEESGKRGEWPLVVGMLVAADPDRHDVRIATLRRRHTYLRPLRYTSTDRNKAELAAALIDHFVEDASLRFTAVVATPGPRRLAGRRSREATNAVIYRPLLKETAGAFPLHLRQAVTGLPDHESSDAASANLAQLGGFLAGCVYGDVTGIRHGLKRDLIERLKGRLGVPTLTVSAARFSVTHIAL